MRKILIHVALLVAIAGTATARIGETPEECEARYGERYEVSADGRRVTFIKGGIQTQCLFLDGKAIHLMFRPLSMPPGETFHRPHWGGFVLPPAMVDAILAANSGDRAWIKNMPELGRPTVLLHTEGGEIEGVFNSSVLALWTREWALERRALLTEQELAKTVEGF